MSNRMTETPVISPSATVINSRLGKYCSVGDNTRFCYSELGDFSYVSVNSNVFSTRIGKFSSISWNVSINPAVHDYQRFTQHPMLFASKYGMLQDNHPFYRQYGDTVIGNDAWIGCNVLIMGGVAIGDGAVIGAGARISHDVPPYAVMIGNNNHMRNRFSDEIIENLIELKWWDLPIEVIRQNISILAENPTLENIQELKNILAKKE